MDPLSAIVACVNGDSRHRLRECMRSSRYRMSVTLVTTLGELNDAVSSAPNLDFIVIGGTNVEASAVAAQDLSRALGDSCPPMVALLGGNELNGSGVANAVRAGFTAIMLDPPSVDRIDEGVHTVLSSEGYRTFREAKNRAMLKVLLSSARGLIDRRATAILGNRHISADDHREWKRIQAQLSADDASSGGEMFWHVLESVLAAAEPFEARVERRFRKHSFHPAKVVGHMMAKRNITPEKLAQALHMELLDLSEFLAQRREMSPELAEKLGRVLGHGTDYWLSFRS